MTSPDAINAPPTQRRIVKRTRGQGGGPITRLMSPSDLGETLKPFVFLDIINMDDSLPIRLTPMTATCRVPPLSRVKLGIGWSRGVARDAEQ